MLLAVDVDNTDTTIGVLHAERVVETWRTSTDPARTPDELALTVASLLRLKDISLEEIAGVAIASVVPNVTQALREMVPAYFGYEPFVVGAGIKTGMPVLIDNPREVGADRITNAVAAHTLYGGPVLVCMVSGTATTFDAVSDRGEYLGGAIAPGPTVSAEALFEHGAQLKRVEFVAPRHLIGRSTVEAIQSGVVFGYAALVSGMLERFRSEVGDDVQTVMTGGAADLVVPHVDGIDAVEPWLALKGLQILFERNV